MAKIDGFETYIDVFKNNDIINLIKNNKDFLI